MISLDLESQFHPADFVVEIDSYNLCLGIDKEGAKSLINIFSNSASNYFHINNGGVTVAYKDGKLNIKQTHLGISEQSISLDITEKQISEFLIKTRDAVDYFSWKSTTLGNSRA